MIRLACAVLLLAPPLFALLTFQHHYEFMAFRQFSLPILMAEGLIVLFAMRSGFAFGPALRALPRRAQIAGGVLALVAIATTLLAAIDPLNAKIQFFTTAIHAVFVLAIWDRFCTNWQGEQARVLIALGGGIVLYIVCVLGLSISVSGSDDFDWIAFGIGVSNVRQLGFYGLALSGIGAGFLATARQPRERMLAALALLIGLAFVDWSGGRAAFLASMAMIACVTLFAPADRRLPFIARAGALVLLAIALSILAAPHESFGAKVMLSKLLGLSDAPAEAGYSNGRLAIWLGTWKQFLAQPLIGHGEGQFRHGVAAAQGLFNHPHNSPLQFLYQWGAIGTGALAALLLGPVSRMVSALRAQPRLTLASLGVISGLGAMSLLDGAFYYPFPIMVSLICLALLSSVKTQSIAARI